MHAGHEETQAPSRTERVGYMVSREEKRDVQLVAAFDNATESDTVRAHTLDQIRQRAEQIRRSADASVA